MDLKRLLYDEDPTLYRHIEDVRDAAEHILENPLHHHYTDHSLRHSERVIEILNILTEELMDSAQRLTTIEIYILLAATYLHDIGMQDRRSIPDTEYRNVQPDETYYDEYIAALERIRERHHEFTEQMILDHIFQRNDYVDLGLPRIPIVDEKVALVAGAHRKVDLSLDSFEDVAGDRRNPTRPRLLAALLRFADELDIDHKRVYMDRLKLIRPPTRSRYHWYLSYYVHVVQMQDEMITICYRFPSGCRDYEELIEPLVDKPIRSKHHELVNIFWPNRVKSLINPISKRQFSELIDPLPPDVKTLARKELSRLQQNELEKTTPPILSLSPDPLVSETFDAQ